MKGRTPVFGWRARRESDINTVFTYEIKLTLKILFRYIACHVFSCFCKFSEN